MVLLSHPFLINIFLTLKLLVNQISKFKKYFNIWRHRNFKFIFILKALLILIFFKKKLFNKKFVLFFNHFFVYARINFSPNINKKSNIYIFLNPLLGGFIHIYYLKKKNCTNI